MLKSFVRFVVAAANRPVDMTAAKLEAEAIEHRELVARINRRLENRARTERYSDFVRKA